MEPKQDNALKKQHQASVKCKATLGGWVGISSKSVGQNVIDKCHEFATVPLSQT